MSRNRAQCVATKSTSDQSLAFDSTSDKSRFRDSSAPSPLCNKNPPSSSSVSLSSVFPSTTDSVRPDSCCASSTIGVEGRIVALRSPSKKSKGLVGIYGVDGAGRVDSALRGVTILNSSTGNCSTGSDSRELEGWD